MADDVPDFQAKETLHHASRRLQSRLGFGIYIRVDKRGLAESRMLTEMMPMHHDWGLLTGCRVLRSLNRVVKEKDVRIAE